MKIKKRITPEELRKFKGFENHSDEQAEEAIMTIERLAMIFYELFMKQKKIEKHLKLIRGNDDEEIYRNAA